MRNRHFFIIAVFAVTTLLHAGLFPARLQAQAQDPVEDLKAALPASPADESDPAARKKNVEAKIKALTTPGQLRRALELTGWQDDKLGRPKTADIDREMRAKVGERLKVDLQQIADRGDSTGK